MNRPPKRVSTYDPASDLHDPHGPAAAGHEFHGPHHYGTVHFVLSFIVLMGLLLATFGISKIDFTQYIGNFGSIANLLFALVIALIKAALVVCVFMGVARGTRLTWLWAAIGFLWLLLFFGFAMDYGARNWQPSIGWERL